MFTITELAATKIEALCQKENTPTFLLRIAVQGGGCSGLSYSFTFVKNHSDQDKVFKINNQTVVIDPKSYNLYLKDCTLDWQETLMKSGFVIKNPHEAKRCSCGESFSPK